MRLAGYIKVLMGGPFDGMGLADQEQVVRL